MTLDWPCCGSIQGWPVRPLSGTLQTFTRPVAAQSEWPELAGCRSSTDNLIWYSVLHIYCVAVLPLLLYFPRIGVVNRNPRKFRRPSRRSTGKLLDALGKASERFVHVLQCLGFCALRA